MSDCAVKACKNKALPGHHVWDVNGCSFPSCDCCDQEEDKEYERDELTCATCDDEGWVEGPNTCGQRGGCSDGMCGGCFAQEPCLECNEGGGEREPDYDAMRDEREDLNAEVEWESRY